MADKVYCYPDSNVLINKLDIREQEKLYTFERKLTMLRLLELIDKPIKGNFDFCLPCIRFGKEMGERRENLYVLWQ